MMVDAGSGMVEAGCWMQDAKERLVHTSVNKHQPSSILHPAFSTPTKNDVLVGPEYAAWSPGQDPLVSNGLNYYYSDIPADGVYNHFELRRHKRAYTLLNPSGGIFFQQGDLAPPMDEAADWLDTQVFAN